MPSSTRRFVYRAVRLSVPVTFSVLTGRAERLRLRDDVGIVPYAGCRMVWFDRAGGISGLRDDMGISPCAKKAKTRLALLGVSRVKTYLHR